MGKTLPRAPRVVEVVVARLLLVPLDMTIVMPGGVSPRVVPMHFSLCAAMWKVCVVRKRRTVWPRCALRTHADFTGRS